VNFAPESARRARRDLTHITFHFSIPEDDCGERGTDMNSRWRDELLALVAHYGEQCSELATERARGVHGHPPADRAGAWAAILAHLSHEPSRTADAKVPVSSA